MSTASSGRLPEIISTLKLLKNVVALAPLGEHVGAGIELAISICEMAQSAKANRAAYEELGLRIAALLAGISNVVQKAPPDRLSSVQSNIQDVIGVLTDARDVVRTQTARSTKSSKSILKVFKGPRAEKYVEEIAALEAKISAALERFHIESHIRLELVTQHVIEMMNDQKTRLAAIQDILSRDAEMARLDKLTYISSARYDSDELQDQVMTCLQGTRTDLLADLDAWATSPDSAPFFWLNGLAGTGKSTVARTFCQRLSERKDTSVVFASFFMSRHSTDRRKALNILHTLVYQLALRDDTIRSHVTRLLAQEPDLLSRSLGLQVSKLLGDSVARAEGSRPIILVLDALDECEADLHGREGGQLLVLLARACSMATRSVKLLVTSRLEPTIREMFDEIQASTSRPQVIQLHDIDRTVVRGDIQQYLVHSFRNIARQAKVSDWPSNAQVDLILDNADVLFIYAATMVRYIGHRQFDPQERLDHVLAQTSKSSQSAYRQLDGLYQGVLANAVMGAAINVEDEPEVAQRLQTMLGTVVLLLQRLPPTSIASLLGWSVRKTEIALARLTAVFIVQEDEPVRIFHPSFPDFLLDSARCTDARLQVDARTHHTILARCCLAVMNSLLHKDVLHTGLDSVTDNDQIHDLDARLKRFMPSHLLYAVCFWMSHMFQGVPNDDLHSVLETFCHVHLLHWLECLSYLGKIDLALSDLAAVTEHLQDSVASKELLVDLYHTLRQYYSPIRDSAAHVYHSALATMPSCRLYELNSHEMGDTVICKPRRTVFVPGVMYMQDGSTSTTTLALSSDGSQVAFYCPIILSVGSTNSGDTSFKFGTESAGFISALQFSPDGHRLLCADNRGRLHSKELDDGHLWSYLPAADPIEGTWTVSSAAFSSNGQYCVFNLITKPDLTNSESPKFISSPSIRLVMRRLEFGAKHHVLHDSSEGLQHSSNAIFTPDAHYVIQAYGNVMSVWNVARHVLHTRVESSEAGLNSLSDIRALAAVSNTTYASLTSGGTITIWDLVQGTHLRTFSVVDFTASLTVAGLASSSDGSLLGVVVDNIVKIVSAADGQLVAQHTLPRRRGRHFGIAFIIFDDTKFRVVVAFPQHPVFVWSYKLARQSHMETSTTLADTRVSCTSFSADGSLVVSGAEDGSMTIWKCDTGLPTTQYAGKGAAIAASFSAPNPRFVLSVRVAGIYLFSPFVLQVDDTQTGDTLRPSKYSSNLETYTATLSPDEKYLAMRFKPLSAYQPGNQGGIIILILDIQTGETVASSLDLQEGISTSNTYIVSYTPDGLIPVQDAVNESLIVRDAQTLDVRHILRHSDAYIFGYTMLSPCSTRVARISHGGGHVRVWSLESGADLFTAYIGKADHAKPWELLMPVWTHSGLMYASSQSLSTWSFDESKSVVVHMWPTESTPRSLYMSQDLSYLYAWCEDHHIRVWAIAHGFDMLEPILKLDASPWPETVKRALWWRHLMIASHNDTELRAVVRHGQHHLFVVINLDDGVCVRVTPFGDGQELDDRIPMAIVSNRLYMRYPEGDIGYLAKRLAQIPFDEDTDAAQWLKTVSDTCETLQRALWQVWNVETGEMEAIITASGTTMKLEALPPSFPLRQSHPEGDEEHALLQIYDYSTARLRIYSGSPLKQVYSLGIPSDRRPAIDVGSQTIATHGSCVAMGSKHGTVSILDFSKAVKAAEARGMMSPQSSTVWTDIS